MSNSNSGRDKIPPAKREMRRQIDGFECQTCPAAAPRAGGTAILHVHHKDPEPTDRDRHDLRNLVTLCADCHSWNHNRPTGEELPIDFTASDRHTLLPHDYIILRILHETGPLPTTEVHKRVGLDLTTQTVRERLWILGGLDYEVSSRNTPLVAKDAVSGEWGLIDDISLSERGRIPSDTRTFMRRTQDEMVRRAVSRGCDRQTIANVFGVVERTIWYRQRRAQAFDFPLDSLLDGEIPDEGVGGRSIEDRHQNTDSDGGEAAVTDLGEPDEVWGTTRTVDENIDDLFDRIS